MPIELTARTTVGARLVAIAEELSHELAARAAEHDCDGTYPFEAIEAQGLQVREVRKNDYRFISERALDACSTYAVESISLVATTPHH